jgi:hypothetical protein
MPVAGKKSILQSTLMALLNPDFVLSVNPAEAVNAHSAANAHNTEVLDSCVKFRFFGQLERRKMIQRGYMLLREAGAPLCV